MGRLWRVYHSDLPDDPGASLRLDIEESHHVSRVLRRRPGDRLGVFDGKGTEWQAVIVRVDPGCVELRLDSKLDVPVEAPVRIVLYQALCRAERMEWLIQKSTELGVAAIHPMATDLSETKPPAPAKLSRWHRIAMEACKQSGRRILPRICPLPALPEPPSDILAILLDTRDEAEPLGDLLQQHDPGEVWLTIGPEGGLTESESERWSRQGWCRAALGPRVLRTETAGIVAITIVQNTWGDVGRRSRRPEI